MEDLLTYSKYEQVLCLVFDEDEQLVIYRSSNRAIEMEALAVLPGDTLLDKSLQSLLKECLDAYAKEQHQRSEREKDSIMLVQQYARQLRRNLEQDERALFDGCQFLFCLPLGWTGNTYIHGIRTLFMEAGWTTHDDPRNRLILSPFTEGLLQSLIADNIIHLGREKKYLLLSLDKAAIHLLSFRMQNAKELIAVSKKLAASDFLLVPTDLGNAVSMDFTDLDLLMYSSVKEILIGHIKSSMQRKRFYKKGSFKYRNGNKTTTQKQHSNINAASQPLFSVLSLHQVIDYIVNWLYEIYYTDDKSKPLHALLDGPEEFRQILRGLTCGGFIYKLLTNENIKGIVNQLIYTVKELYSKYSDFQGSPDGIQDVILHCHSQANIFCREIFRIALREAKFIDAENYFAFETEGRDICFGAMQKPFKMVQIANALLPPIVWNGGDSKQIDLLDYDNNNNCEQDLLPPNSFYVQAYLNDGHIRFILNKVVAVSSTNEIIQKSTFTVQEASVELQDIIESVCDNMWNHLMTLEHLAEVAGPDDCDTHLEGGYSAANYHFFKCSIKWMIEELLQKSSVKLNRELDIKRAIPISRECSCSFKISFRTLMNLGLQPVISHIATIIASALASNSFFGPYAVSALIILDDSREMFLQNYQNVFKKALRSRLEAHHRRPIVFYDRQTVLACGSLGSWSTGSQQQVFGTGSYSQVSSTDYVLEFSSREGNDYDEGFAMNKYHSNSFEQGDCIERPYKFVILEKGHAIDPNGSIHVFYQTDGSLSCIHLDLYIINRHKEKVCHHRIWSHSFRYVNMFFPIAIRVTPQHHSSTIEFEVSHLRDYKTGCLDLESFIIQEKLALK